jgi:hypothetical protein
VQQARYLLYAYGHLVANLPRTCECVAIPVLAMLLSRVVDYSSSVHPQRLTCGPACCAFFSVCLQREAQVLELRFGLNGGVPMTLEDIGRQFSVTRYVKPRAFNIYLSANLARKTVFRVDLNYGVQDNVLGHLILLPRFQIQGANQADRGTGAVQDAAPREKGRGGGDLPGARRRRGDAPGGPAGRGEGWRVA